MQGPASRVRVHRATFSIRLIGVGPARHAAFPIVLRGGFAQSALALRRHSQCPSRGTPRNMRRFCPSVKQGDLQAGGSLPKLLDRFVDFSHLEGVELHQGFVQCRMVSAKVLAAQALSTSEVQGSRPLKANSAHLR